MTHLKMQKLQKSDYPPAHHLNVNVLLSNITFCRFRCVIRRVQAENVLPFDTTSVEVRLKDVLGCGQLSRGRQQ